MMRPFRGMNRFSRGDTPARAEELIGGWRAAGLREGLDLRTPDGRMCYYPVGRGGVAFDADGTFTLRTVNASGALARKGRWALDDGVLRVHLGGDEGRFCPRVEAGALRLTPDRTFARCADKLLHAPAFQRE